MVMVLYKTHWTRGWCLNQTCNVTDQTGFSPSLLYINIIQSYSLVVAVRLVVQLVQVDLFNLTVLNDFNNRGTYIAI